MTGVVESDERNPAAEVTASFRGAGNAMVDERRAPTCNFEGSECYNVKVMPTVAEISAQEGYAEGGQELVIKGTSLDGHEVSVTVDGLPCEVNSISQSELTCSTAKKEISDTDPTPASYIG